MAFLEWRMTKIILSNNVKMEKAMTRLKFIHGMLDYLTSLSIPLFIFFRLMTQLYQLEYMSESQYRRGQNLLLVANLVVISLTIMKILLPLPEGRE